MPKCPDGKGRRRRKTHTKANQGLREESTGFQKGENSHTQITRNEQGSELLNSNTGGWASGERGLKFAEESFAT